jgi:hypothetical protein
MTAAQDKASENKRFNRENLTRAFCEGALGKDRPILIEGFVAFLKTLKTWGGI